MSDNLKKRIVKTPKAAQPVGPYNQAIVVGDMVYVSGCIALDKDTCELIEGGVKEQTEQALHNMHMVLRAACSGYSKVVKTTIMLTNMEDFETVNEVYNRVFEKDSPARSTFQVAALPKGALVEIDCIAISQDPRKQQIAANNNNNNNRDTDNYDDDEKPKRGGERSTCLDECPGNKAKREAAKKAQQAQEKEKKGGESCDVGCAGRPKEKCGPPEKPKPAGPTTICVNRSCPAKTVNENFCDDGPGFGSGSVLNKEILSKVECPNTCGGKPQKSKGPMAECPDTCAGKNKPAEKPAEKPAAETPAPAPAEAPPAAAAPPPEEAPAEPPAEEPPAAEAPAEEAPAEEGGPV